jgi:glyoxylase-like metal-dependent hydrolase (beta-lactamase superfamily II)
VPAIADPGKQEMHLYRRLMWGAPQPVEGVIPLDEVEDEIRTPAYRFRAVETPGHSRDHVVYFEPCQRWVFSGDVFMSGHDRTWASEFDLFGVIASLQTLVSLEPERLFSGSGQMRRTPTLDIQDKINYLRQLTRQVSVLTAQGKNPLAIAQKLFPDEAYSGFWTQGHFSAVKLVEACISYNTIFSPGDETSTNLSAPPKAPGSTKPSPKRSTGQAT